MAECFNTKIIITKHSPQTISHQRYNTQWSRDLKMNRIMKKQLLLLLLLMLSVGLWAQKKSLTVDDFDNWKRLGSAQLSSNGKWLSFEQTPYKGDGELRLQDAEGKEELIFSRGYSARFSGDGSFFTFKVKPQTDSVRALKLKKVKKDKLPKDSLFVYLTEAKKTFSFPAVKTLKVAQDGGEWIAFTLEKKKEASKPKEKNKKEDKKKKRKKRKKKDKKKNKKEEKKKDTKPKAKDKNAPKTSELFLLNPIKGDTITIKNVSAYTISKNGQAIAYVVLKNDTIVQSSVYVFDTKKAEHKLVFKKEGIAKSPSLSEKSEHLAFLFSADTIKNKTYDLYFTSGFEKVNTPLISVGNPALPKDWTASENGSLIFSRDASKLYFKTALKPEPEKKDTILEEEKVKVDIWHWKDLRLQPQQLVRLKSDKKRAYQAVYHIADNKVVPLNDKFHRSLLTFDFKNANFGLLSDREPYLREKSWNLDNGSDYYFVNFKTGKKKLILKASRNSPSISKDGKYFSYYSASDKAWKIVNTETSEETKYAIPYPVFDEEFDYPQNPSPYGRAGWTEDGKCWVYDRYDIWQLDPEAKQKPINLTNGRSSKTKYRYTKINHEVSYIDNKFVLLSSFEEATKRHGFVQLEAGKVNKLTGGDYRYGTPRKAKKADVLLWSRSNFQEYPNYRISGLDFKNPRKISDANPQQKDFKWGTVELFKWKVDGKEEEGLLFKPENFDPKKKYPVVVYFYRLYSDLLYRHISPKPSRSIINPTFYVSNDYIVFIPNVRFEIGHPGKSSTKYITSGAKALAKLPYIDGNHMGIQGQSWGGYQVSYIVTQTDMFKAAWAGAPVSNMTSAYGGIRWASGMSRMFQYEKTQSRIGATLWKKPELYIENSPVFHAPKINTPLAIMHNDNDGAVPWYQGIELFVALRRLEKPVWMLNYNKQPHNLASKTPNSKDLSIRLMQFFDHYLKEKPAPEWMTHGIPALKKGKNLGYDIKE